MYSKDQLVECFADIYPRLLEYAVGISGDRDRALDMVQSLAVNILKLPDDKRIEYREAYLYRSLRRIAIDVYRKESRYSYMPSEDLDQFPARDCGEDAKLSEARMFIDQCLDGCSPEMRQAFVRHFLYGEPMSDLAKELGMKAVVLRQRISRMKKKIPKDILLLVILILAISEITGHTVHLLHVM